MSSLFIYLFSFSDKFGIGPGTWGPNLEQFQNRFSPETTKLEGPQWLKNLYFTYLVELRALAKIAPYLEQVRMWAGKFSQIVLFQRKNKLCTADISTKLSHVQQLLYTVKPVLSVQSGTKKVFAWGMYLLTRGSPHNLS